MSVEERYWDSSCFLGWFNGELDKKDSCEGVIRAAENGHVKIITSAFTLVEVLYLKGSSKIPADKSTQVKEFFERSYIATVNVDREIAGHAQEVVWKYNILPKDAIHIATAEFTKIGIFDTFDIPLIGHSGKIGNPLIAISRPYFPYEPPIPGL